MKLKINNKFQEVDFWSFMKCNFLTQLALTGLIWAGLIMFGILLGISEL